MLLTATRRASSFVFAAMYSTNSGRITEPVRDSEAFCQAVTTLSPAVRFCTTVRTLSSSGHAGARSSDRYFGVVDVSLRCDAGATSERYTFLGGVGGKSYELKGEEEGRDVVQRGRYRLEKPRK